MSTNVPGNRFNMIHFQLYSMAGDYLASFGEGYAAGNVSGQYVHDLPSGYYMLRFKGNTNKADDWVRIRVFLEEGVLIDYNYNIEELTGDVLL